MDTLKIEIVSDVVCPWCVIGFRNLKKAIEELENELSFKISWKPYELHPEIPENGYDKELYMQQKFGSNLIRRQRQYNNCRRLYRRVNNWATIGLDFALARFHFRAIKVWMISIVLK